MCFHLTYDQELNISFHTEMHYAQSSIQYTPDNYSGHSDIVATFLGTKWIYSIIFRSDIVANRICWPLYPKYTVLKGFIQFCMIIDKPSDII